MFEILPVDQAVLKRLRRLQAQQLYGPANLYADERLGRQGALHLGMYISDGLRGYASFGPEQHQQRQLLEIFVQPGSRGAAAEFLQQALAWVPPGTWELSSYDRFGLSLALQAGFKLDRTDSYLFSWDGAPGIAADAEPGAALPSGFRLRQAREEDLPVMTPVMQEDGFFTEDWSRLPLQTHAGLWHLAVGPDGSVAGVGYAEPIPRTPWCSDTGVVVAPFARHRGLGTGLLREMVRLSLERDLIPAAICSRSNTASKRMLERAGFYCDGRIWSVWTRSW